MAKLQIIAKNLKSRKVRKKSVGSSGKRKFAGNVAKSQKDGDKGGIGQFFSSVGQFASSMISKGIDAVTGFLNFSLSALWGGVVSAFTFAYNFDWNISDQDLDQQALGSFAELGSGFGSLTGTALGWLSCGALPATAIASFNPSLGVLVKQQVGPAAMEAIASEFGNLLQSSANALGKYAFAYLYKNLRNFVRGTDQEFFDKKLSEGVDIKELKKAMADRKKPFILSQKVEDKISKIKDPFLQNFASSLIDNLGESCVEAGYVIAGAADDYFAKQKLSRNPLLGSETTIEVSFDDEDKPVFKRQQQVEPIKFTN